MLRPRKEGKMRGYRRRVRGGVDVERDAAEGRGGMRGR